MVKNCPLLELSHCDIFGVVLEFFGDVVVVLGVLQKCNERVRCLLHQ